MFENMGIYASGWTTSVPNVADVPIQDKQDRIFKNVSYEATLEGAIQGLVIRGNVSF